MFAGSQTNGKRADIGQRNSYSRTETGWFVGNIAEYWLWKDWNTPLNMDSRWLSPMLPSVFARSQCKTLPLCSHSGCDVSLTSRIPNTSLLLCLSPQWESQTGVLRLVACCEFSMHGAGESVLLGFEFVKDGESCTRLSLIKIALSWEMLNRCIRGKQKCDGLQSYCKWCL